MVIYVVKAAFVPLSAIGENPANAGVARLCGVSQCPVPDTATALPNLSGILFPLVYSGFRRFLICFTYSLTLLSPLFPGVPEPYVVNQSTEKKNTRQIQLTIEGHKVTISFAQEANPTLSALVRNTLLDAYIRKNGLCSEEQPA